MMPPEWAKECRPPPRGDLSQDHVAFFRRGATFHPELFPSLK